MNRKIKNRTLGATAVLAVLLGSAACGNETVSDTDPGNQPAAKPPVVASPYAPHGTSADRAEREAAAEKARQDRASTDRWARGTQIENKLKRSGHPSQP
jgi:hypothetical protein